MLFLQIVEIINTKSIDNIYNFYAFQSIFTGIYTFNYYYFSSNIGLVFISSKWQRASKAADKLVFLYFLLLTAASFLVLFLTPLQQPGLLLGPDSGKDRHKEQSVLQDKLQ